MERCLGNISINNSIFLFIAAIKTEISPLINWKWAQPLRSDHPAVLVHLVYVCVQVPTQGNYSLLNRVRHQQNYKQKTGPSLVVLITSGAFKSLLCVGTSCELFYDNLIWEH